MNVITWTIVTAIVLGLICYLGGTFIPMWTNPESNLAPIAGVFLGPVGFIVGAVVGCVIGIVRNRRSRRVIN
jgi:hypothetical protein